MFHFWNAISRSNVRLFATELLELTEDILASCKYQVIFRAAGTSYVVCFSADSERDKLKVYRFINISVQDIIR